MIELKEGNFVMGMTKEGMVHGRVEHIMTEGGTLGTPGSEYSLVSMPPDNPAMSVRVYEEEDGKWEETAYSIGMMYLDATKLERLEGHEMNSEKEMAMYDASIGKSECCPEDISKQAPCWDGYVQRGMKPGADGKPVPNCIPVTKTESIFFSAKDYSKQTRVTNLFKD
jgi:hypothetical protein